MLLDTRRGVARMLPAPTMRIATAFIAPDGGRPNIAAKVLATLWYLLILPDSHSRFTRQLHRKRLPWYAPSRLLGLAVSAANIVAMPASWVLLLAGRRNAARIASLGVIANPPSFVLSLLLAQELASQIAKLSSNFVSATGSLIARPVLMILPSEQTQPDQQDQSEDQNQDQSQGQSPAQATESSVSANSTTESSVSSTPAQGATNSTPSPTTDAPAPVPKA